MRNLRIREDDVCTLTYLKREVHYFRI